jgi:uncharacterized protein YecE (DUF72 family)
MSTTNFHVGTSGYSYKEWKGSFYPKDLPADQMLRYYAERFGSVEMNNTFYRMPKPSVIEAWAEEVPSDFKFVIKAPQRITHFQRLRGANESVSYLVETVAVLKQRLGPLLFQLPGNFKKDLPRLREFLSLLPAGQSAAFEFRHESWFDDEVFDLLRGRNVALCVAEADDTLSTPFVSTADWGYLRLRLPAYSDGVLGEWIERVRKQKWRDAFVFFKHEDEAKGPSFAARFLKLAGQTRKS